MSKQITAKELAAIFKTALTTNEIDDAGRFSEFMTSAATLLADHFGGEVLGAADNNMDGEWMIGIAANESLPPDGGIWKPYDTAIAFIDGQEVEGEEVADTGMMRHNVADALQCAIDDVQSCDAGASNAFSDADNRDCTLRNLQAVESMLEDVRELGAAIEEGDVQHISDRWMGIKKQISLANEHSAILNTMG